MIAAAVLLACAVAVLAVWEETFSGKNGKIAYASYDGSYHEIYTINPGVGGRFQITNNTDELDKR